ncbi:PREDICTED: uncharacterized protein LOC104810186 [Tarenaya hassleriana]|uniref:uncharacterized protein LOC104810186 n=1 Tax=Tarenaya hassleriana TaxID=28532 RepID=UPI00053C966A|nr:PREDICTED: uncharacterized protein LOC104810186 [Tarenaya hassleriana]
MRILATRLVNYCLKGSVISLYSHQSRSWCSWEGNRGESEEIKGKIQPKPANEARAIEDEMVEMRREMSMLKAKLKREYRTNHRLMSKLKQVSNGQVEEECDCTVTLGKKEITVAALLLILYLILGPKPAVVCLILCLLSWNP